MHPNKQGDSGLIHDQDLKMEENSSSKDELKYRGSHRHDNNHDDDSTTSNQRIQQLEEQIALLQRKVDHKIDLRRLEIRFNQGDVMTFFACKWYFYVTLTAIGFYYMYFVLRQNWWFGIGGLDDISGGLRANFVAYVLSFSGAYVFMTVLDFLHVTICPDKEIQKTKKLKKLKNREEKQKKKKQQQQQQPQNDEEQGNVVQPRVNVEGRNTDHTHVIVAAHRAADSLKSMLPSILQTFDPSCVWVADNGHRDGGETKRICDELGVNYCFNTFGNKCNSLLVVARHIQRRFGKYGTNEVKNVMLLDDDTHLADDFFIRHDLLARKDVGGYCVGIGVKRSPPFNVWEAAIDYEYRSISYGMQARAVQGTMRFAHGIVAVYKLDLMVDIYKKNWALPGGLAYGEDGYAGMLFRLHGHKIVQDNANLVLTYCPRRFFPPNYSLSCGQKQGRTQGYGAHSLLKQRGQRWFTNFPRHFCHELYLFCTYNSRNVWGNINYRIYMLWWFFISSTSVLWLPYLLYVLTHDDDHVRISTLLFVAELKGVLTVTSILVATLRILAFPPKLREGLHPLAPFCAPILGTANTLLRFYGFVYSILYYIPFRRPDKLEVLGDIDDLDFPPMVSSSNLVSPLPTPTNNSFTASTSFQTFPTISSSNNSSQTDDDQPSLSASSSVSGVCA